MSRNFLTWTAVFAIATLAPQPLRAALNEGSGSLLDYAGILLGGDLSHPGNGVQPSLGIDGGVQIQAGLGVGGFIGYSSRKTDNSSDTSTTYMLAAEADYFADSLWIGSRIGLKSGAAWQPNTHSLDGFFGPLLGYDYAIGNGFSMGAEASLLLTTTSPLTESLSLFFAGRYWF